MKNSVYGTREYFTTLNNHKEVIKTNKYARELEIKYHKINHQSFKDPLRSTYSSGANKSPIWPIESQAFNNILRSKLHDTPRHVYLKPSAHHKIVSEFQKTNSRNLTSFQTDLPNIYKGRYWSPPKLDQNAELLSNFNNGKIFGPKIKKVW